MKMTAQKRRRVGRPHKVMVCPTALQFSQLGRLPEWHDTCSVGPARKGMVGIGK